MKNIQKNIIVTGCNRGIGLGIISNLLKKQGWNIIMACRHKQKANQTRQSLLRKYPNALLHVEKLNINQQSSITQFKDIIANKYGEIDVLINNAGIRQSNFNTEAFRQTFSTNFHGVINLTESLLPKISQLGKIIIIGASYFKIGLITNDIIRSNLKKPNLSKEQLIEQFKLFQQSIKQEKTKQNGWPKEIYGMSKLAVSIYGSVLGRYPQIVQNQIQVNVLCPGMVKTELSNNKGALSIEESGSNIAEFIEKPFEWNQAKQGKLISSKGQIIQLL